MVGSDKLILCHDAAGRKTVQQLEQVDQFIELFLSVC